MISLEMMKEIDWEVAMKTFGNNHSTLIGLIVSWWIMGDPDTRTALDSGPSFGHRGRNEGGGGACDAVLLQDHVAKGIVEVEGSRYERTIEKIGKYFEAEYDHLKTLEFGILLAYSIGPEGRGDERRIKSPPKHEILSRVKEVTSRYHDKAIAVVILDKEFERITEGLRSKSEYYCCTPQKIDGYLVKEGKIVDECTFAAGGV